MTDTSNYPLVPSPWVEEYLKQHPQFYEFIRQKAREFREEKEAHSQALPLAIIKVVKYHRRTDRYADLYYAERSKLLSVYSMLEEHDINESNITKIACERLNTAKVVRVVPYIESVVSASTESDNDSDTDTDTDTELPHVYFVAKDDLFYDRMLDSNTHCTMNSLWSDIRNALDSRNYVIALQLLNKIPIDEPITSYSQALVYAALRSDSIEIYEKVRDIVGHEEMHVDTNALECIAISNSHNILRYLVKSSPDEIRVLANTIVPKHDLPIHTAASSGSTEITEILLEYTDTETVLGLNTSGFSLLTAAVYYRHCSTVEMLITKPFINDLIAKVGYGSYTALHYAAYNGLDEVVNRLYGIYAEKDLLLAKTQTSGSTNHTFLNYLIQPKHTDILRALIARPDFDPRLVSEVDSHRQTPMMLAIDTESTEICELLYGHTVKTSTLTAVCEKGYNALMYAAVYDLEPVVSLFTSDADLCDQQMIGDANGYTPIHYATLSSIEVCARIYGQASIEKVCTQTTLHQLTALHMAVMYRDVGMVKVLLGDPAKAQALVGIRDTDSRTALDYAMMRSPEMAAVILEAMESQ